MSYLAQRAVLDTRTRVRALSGTAPGLATTAVLTGLAALLLLGWWERGTALPVSWLLPPVETLFLLPAGPVLGLLALRAVVDGRLRTVAAQHLMTIAARWAAVWAATTAVWLAVTAAELYGGFGALLGADNLVEVLGASEAVRGQVTVLWVALLVALFATRLGGWRETLGLLVLTGAALVSGAPAPQVAAHVHATATDPLVLVAAAVEVLALAAWIGALAAVPHLRTPSYQLQHHLTRFGELVVVAALLAGTAAVVAGMLRPATPTPVALALGQLVVVGIVAVVGHRHRRRTVEVVATRRGLLLAGLIAAEVAAMAAVVAIGFLLPVGS